MKQSILTSVVVLLVFIPQFLVANGNAEAIAEFKRQIPEMKQQMEDLARRIRQAHEDFKRADVLAPINHITIEEWKNRQYGTIRSDLKILIRREIWSQQHIRLIKDDEERDSVLQQIIPPDILQSEQSVFEPINHIINLRRNLHGSFNLYHTTVKFYNQFKKNQPPPSEEKLAGLRNTISNADRNAFDAYMELWGAVLDLPWELPPLSTTRQ